MVNYLVFETKDHADSAEQTIFSFGASAAADAGFEVTEEGISNYRRGVPQADKTTKWDTPRQRADGKWVIAHPELNCLAKREPSMLEALLAQITVPYEKEEYQNDWFPPEEV